MIVGWKCKTTNIDNASKIIVALAYTAVEVSHNQW